MRCLIVDDEEMARKNVERLCSKIDGLEIVGICENGMQAISVLESEQIDLLLLDIEMPDLTGMEMVKSLSNLPQIIFTTSRVDFALEAFEYDVTDYITKPVTLPRLIKAINKVKARTPVQQNAPDQSNEKEMFVRSEGKFIKIKYEEILYIETMDDYLVFNIEDGRKHIIHSSLKKIDEKLCHLHFLKVHRSYIINLKKIRSIEDTHILIKEKVIPVSRAHRPTLMKKVNLL